MTGSAGHFFRLGAVIWIELTGIFCYPYNDHPRKNEMKETEI